MSIDTTAFRHSLSSLHFLFTFFFINIPPDESHFIRHTFSSSSYSSHFAITSSKDICIYSYASFAWPIPFFIPRLVEPDKELSDFVWYQIKIGTSARSMAALLAATQTVLRNVYRNQREEMRDALLFPSASLTMPSLDFFKYLIQAALLSAWKMHRVISALEFHNAQLWCVCNGDVNLLDNGINHLFILLIRLRDFQPPEILSSSCADLLCVGVGRI